MFISSLKHTLKKKQQQCNNHIAILKSMYSFLLIPSLTLLPFSLLRISFCRYFDGCASSVTFTEYNFMSCFSLSSFSCNSFHQYHV